MQRIQQWIQGKKLDCDKCDNECNKSNDKCNESNDKCNESNNECDKSYYECDESDVMLGTCNLSETVGTLAHIFSNTLDL
jgi:hypothetical protein